MSRGRGPLARALRAGDGFAERARDAREAACEGRHGDGRPKIISKGVAPGPKV